MTLREAYDLVVDTVSANAFCVANDIVVVSGVQANLSLDDLREQMQEYFATKGFTVIVEYPSTGTVSFTQRMAQASVAFTLIIAENPALSRETLSIDPLEAIYEIAKSLNGVPVTSRGAGGNTFSPASDFLKFEGEANGILFHKINYNITIHL